MDFYQIFCGERFFVISGDEELCFRSLNGIGTRATDAGQIAELFDFFEQSEIPEFYLYSETPELSLNCLLDSNKCLQAAGGLVFDKNENLLLIRRLGYWDLPKGKIEENETEIEAARREIEEECGIKVEIGKKIKETYHTYKLLETRIIKRTVWFEAKYSGNQTPVPQTEEDISEIIWVSKDSIQKYVPEMYASLRTVVL